MKKLLLATVLASATLLTGCSTAPYQPGAIFSSLNAPVGATSNAGDCAKRGTASTTNILGLFGVGDGSIRTAKASAGITTVNSVDYKLTSVLGLFSSTETIVCGK